MFIQPGKGESFVEPFRIVAISQYYGVVDFDPVIRTPVKAILPFRSIAELLIIRIIAGSDLHTIAISLYYDEA